ncbi:hypothetical protein NEDG_01629 [Nematocida displodere]|uniref:EF-hand domain-containing protein n=1 Tax=Nematocida displodere TaxID=1805483 RepID=A0A177EHM6_9MICR|nr:hypothetical protein NEDG_01629 [Nematocida displodere]
MAYVSTQKTTQDSEQDMRLEELIQGLEEMSQDSSGRISREELFKVLTTSGDKFTTTEANQVLSLIPAEEGWISIEGLGQMLFQAQVSE